MAELQVYKLLEQLFPIFIFHYLSKFAAHESPIIQVGLAIN